DWRDVNKTGGERVGSLRVPSLVEVNGGVFAVAEAQCTKNEECSFTGIASELLELNDPNPKHLETANLKTEVLDKFPYEEQPFEFEIPDYDGFESEKKVRVSRPTTVVNGSDIYMLAGNYSWTYGFTKEDAEPPENQWGLLLVTGNVSENEGNGKRIYWNDTYGIPCTLFNQHRGSLTRLIGSGRSGVKMNDGTLVFPVEGTKKTTKAGTENDEKTVSLIIYSLDAVNWKLSKEMSADGCSDPSVVEWEDGKLMMMTACDDGRRRVY
ncbi:trans-sialidase, putative, partial [Trypanosoma cruzi marinkellei]